MWEELVLFEENSPLSRVPEKLLVPQFVKKFPIFYGTQRFITMFTRACHWYLV
jgi:hypothetical protein